MLMDEPAFPGVLMKCRVIGVIEGEQGKKKKGQRNDRIVGVEEENHTYAHIKHVRDLGKKNICGIAVLRFCGGDKAEVVWKGHAGRQHLLKREHLLIRIECELIPAALGSFDDDLNPVLKVFIEWCKARRVGENPAGCYFLGHGRDKTKSY